MQALATLPEELRKDLADALVRLDAQPIAEVIARVLEQDAQLGELVARSANRFAYTAIYRVEYSESAAGRLHQYRRKISAR